MSAAETAQYRLERLCEGVHDLATLIELAADTSRELTPASAECALSGASTALYALAARYAA